MFEKTLTDLIRGLRANKNEEQKYIHHAIIECKREAKSQDLDVKSGAILKLSYLAMFGQDMTWASFYIVETMASTRFIIKRIGYMAAAQGFRQDTDVLMLATNLMKKDLASANPAEISIALSSLGDIVTPDLARDLGHDLVSKLTHSKSIVRKKAVLSMYKIFLQYPDALRSFYPKLRERLEDTDQSVISATINVIVELSRRTPKNFLPLVPTLFDLLTTSSNNWMLIKIIKLFATLTPLEPRLVRKLIPPLIDIIHSTTAKSLLYECINTVISGEMLSISDEEALAQLCVLKLRTFFEDDDQNLKYVGLIAFTKLMQTHPDLVGNHQDVILKAVDDSDLSIRMRALELISLMPTRDTLPDIVKRLILQLIPANAISIPSNFRREIVLRILKMCSSLNYKHMEDFDWYISVLIDLIRISKVDVGIELQNEIQNVCVRVRSVREYAVPELARLITDREIQEGAMEPERNADALCAAAWAIGEYNEHLVDVFQTLNDLIAASTPHLPSHIQISYLQAILKLYCRWTRHLSNFDSVRRTECSLITQKLIRKMAEFGGSEDNELQHRAVEASALFTVALQCVEEEDAADEDACLPKMFTEIIPTLYSSGIDINPVAAKAQFQIGRPEDLELDTWIVPLTPLPSPKLSLHYDAELEVNNSDTLTNDELAARQRDRRERNLDDPFYIQEQSQETSKTNDDPERSHLVAINTDTLADDEILKVKRKKRRPRKYGPVEILEDEMPEGVIGDFHNTIGQRTEDRPATQNVLRVDGTRLAEFSLEETLELSNGAEASPKPVHASTSTLQVIDSSPLTVSKKKKHKKKSAKGKISAAIE